MVLSGWVLVATATKAAQVLGTLCLPILCPQCRGPVRLTESLCALLRGAAFLLLSFVSSLQMQQKVKVTMRSDSHFPLPLWPRCLPTLLLLLLITVPHPIPSPGTLQLRPQPSLAFPNTYGSMPPARPYSQVGNGCVQECMGRGEDPVWDSDAHWWSSVRSSQSAFHRQKPVQCMLGWQHISQPLPISWEQLPPAPSPALPLMEAGHT